MNNPDYCQAIYDAADKVVEFYNTTNLLNLGTGKFWMELDQRVSNLKQALEGKEEKP